MLYEIADEFIRGRRSDGLRTLERIEGPRYEEKRIAVLSANGLEVNAITFTVQEGERRIGLWTSADYVRHILQGLRQYDVPNEYVSRAIEIALETNRRAEQWAQEESRQIESLLL